MKDKYKLSVKIKTKGHILKKILLGAVILMGIIVSGLSGATSYNVSNTSGSIKGKLIFTPHYYEYNENENPDKYYWCAHGALKMALKAQGLYKSLDDIHEDFKVANKGLGVYNEKITNICHTGYCGSPIIIKKTVNKYNKDILGVSYKRDTVVGHKDFLNTVKSNIDKGKVVISLSDKYFKIDSKDNYTGKLGNVGHYFDIIGYINYNDKTYLLLRDTYKEKGGKYWDKIVNSEYFWNNASGQSRPNEMVLSIIGD